MISLLNRQTFGLGVLAGSILINKIYCDSIADVVEKETGLLFGKINSYELLGTGVRQVTFLNFNAYAVGLYIQSRNLKNPSSRWTQEFKAFKLSNSPESEFYSSDLLKKGISLKLVIKTARNTDGPHLRNGFLKMLSTRVKELPTHLKGGVEEDLELLKSLWPVKGTFKKGSSIIITRESDESLCFDFPDNPEFSGFTLRNGTISKLFFASYIGKNAISPSLVASVGLGLERFIQQANFSENFSGEKF